MKNIELRIANFPISFFSMIMGLAGLTIAWQKAQVVFNINLSINNLLLSITSVFFVLFTGLYTVKFITNKEQVMNEFKNPIKLNFFPTISISLLLLSIAFLKSNAAISLPLWITGTGIHLLFTLYIVNAWIHHDHFEVQHVNPAWFIPAVGNVLVPVTGMHLGFVEISWFFFSIGIMFWIILFTIIFNRVMFHNPLQEKLLPTLFILIAPPAVGFIAYMQLTGHLNGFARILYFSGLFLTLLMFAQVRRFTTLEFYLSWWAYSFPLAAITIATFLMYELTQLATYKTIGLILIFLLSIVVFFLLFKTVSAAVKQRICVEET